MVIRIDYPTKILFIRTIFIRNIHIRAEGDFYIPTKYHFLFTNKTSYSLPFFFIVHSLSIFLKFAASRDYRHRYCHFIVNAQAVRLKKNVWTTWRKC